MRRTLALQSPIGEMELGPSLEDLREILFHSVSSYWKSGSRTAELLHVRRRGKNYEIRNDLPTLGFAFQSKHGVLLIHCDNSIEPTIAVPYYGPEFSPWVKHTDGQCDWYVPRACFVSIAAAWAAIVEFCNNDGRIPTLPWKDKLDIEFRLPAAGDKTPTGENRA